MSNVIQSVITYSSFVSTFLFSHDDMTLLLGEVDLKKQFVKQNGSVLIFVINYKFILLFIKALI